MKLIDSFILNRILYLIFTLHESIFISGFTDRIKSFKYFLIEISTVESACKFVQIILGILLFTR